MDPAKQDTEDDFYVTLVLGEATIGSRRVMPTYQSYKKWHQLPSSPATGILSASTEERQREPQDEGSVPEFTTCCDLCCPRRGSSAKSLRGTRDGLIWEQVLGVCVCVFLLWFCYVDPWAEPSPSISTLLHLLALYLLALVSVSSLLYIRCLLWVFPALVT